MSNHYGVYLKLTSCVNCTLKKKKKSSEFRRGRLSLVFSEYFFGGGWRVIESSRWLCQVRIRICLSVFKSFVAKHQKWTPNQPSKQRNLGPLMSQRSDERARYGAVWHLSVLSWWASWIIAQIAQPRLNYCQFGSLYTLKEYLSGSEVSLPHQSVGANT